jgi:multiple antibiotic resistance protein
MKEHLQAIVTVLSLVNPVVCGAMFARIEGIRSSVERRADARKVALAVVVILTLAALIGTRLLDLFGVSLDAFMVAGGGVLAWMGFSMLSGQAASSSSASTDASSNPQRNDRTGWTRCGLDALAALAALLSPQELLSDKLTAGSD